MKIQAVIFDLDGTLTEPFLDFELIRRQMGILPEQRCILDALRQMPPDQQKQATAILEHYEQQAAENSRLNAGAVDLLQTLRRRQIPIGILTRNSRKNVQFVAQKHRICFDAVISREDGPVKPDAFGVLELCRKFQAEPKQTLVVGDFQHDLEAAKNADAIAILLKNHPKADTFAHLADFVIENLIEVLDIIQKLEK